MESEDWRDDYIMLYWAARSTSLYLMKCIKYNIIYITVLEDILDLLLQVIHVDKLFHVQQVQLPPGLTARLTSLFVPIL